jgi:integrase/recombinase XerD
MIDEKHNDINALEVLSSVVPPAAPAPLVAVHAKGGRLVRERPRALPAEAAYDALYSVRSQETLKESLNRALRCLGVDVDKERDAWRTYPWTSLEYTDLAFIAGELAKRYRRATVAVTLSALRSVFRHAWKLEYIDRERLERMRSIETPRGSSLQAGRRLSIEDTQALRGWAGGLEGARGALVRGCFALAIGAGLRAEELCGAPVEAWDTSGVVRVVGKGRKEREVPVGASESACLEAWLEARAALRVKTPWLFVRLGGAKPGEQLNSQWLGRLCAEAAAGAGAKSFSPHDCRRTFCSALLDAGVDLATVQRLMGHESPRTTARYDRRQADDDARVRRAVTLW